MQIFVYRFVYILNRSYDRDVETISANVKMGLKMKMKRGELIGYNGSLGYDYHPEDKSITVNEKEAETVRLIFDLQVLRMSRAHQTQLSADGKREKYMRKYALSSMCECGFCGTKLTRRTFHSSSTYEKPVKYDEFTNKITKLVDVKEVLLENVKEQKNIGKRMSELRLAHQKEDVLNEFDRTVFESIVEKVIVGSEDEDGNIDPFKLTFVFKWNGSKSLEDVKERYKNLTRGVG